MTNQGEIQKFLYSVGNKRYSDADKALQKIIKDKVNKMYQEAYKRIIDKTKKK